VRAVLHLESVRRCYALAIEHTAGGVPLPRPVVVYAPADLVQADTAAQIAQRRGQSLLKAWSGLGTTYQDADGDFRWVTVHPHGEGSEGTPVKIRPSKTHPGTWHVVAGAGGKLNYLRLHNVRSPEEHRAQADERRAKARVEKTKHSDAERQRKAALTPEQREAEAKVEHTRKTERASAGRALASRKEEQVARVAKALGWKDAEWRFDAEPLTKSGATPQDVARLKREHETRLQDRVRDAVRQTKRLLLLDQDEASQVLAGGEVAPSDLLEEKTSAAPRVPVGRDAADRTVRAELGRLDRSATARSLGEVETALAETGGHDDVLAARADELRTRLHAAELLERGTTLTPEAIATRQREIAAELRRLGRAADAARPALQAAEEAAAAAPVQGTNEPTLAPGHAALRQRALTDAAKRDTLQREAADLAVLAGDMGSIVAAEGRTAGAAATQAREEAIRRRYGAAALERHRALRTRLAAARAQQDAALRHFRATGVLPPEPSEAKPVVDPEVALQLIATQKAIEQAERTLRGGAGVDLDERMFGKASFVRTGTPTPAMVAGAEREMRGRVEERLTRAFLDRIESPELLAGRGAPAGDDPHALHHALAAHLGEGAYQALNTASLAALKKPILSREVVDVLGAGPAAALLAHAIRERSTKPAMRAMAERLGEYHVARNVTQATERVHELEGHLDAADEALAACTNPSDLAIAAEANRRRGESIESARQAMGQTLGEYEATAALVHALGQSETKALRANLGPIGTETAVRQLRALGLGRDDYALTSDGTNWFATVQPSGFGVLTMPVDRKHEALVDDMLAIKRGERDEVGWVPKGAAPGRTVDGKYVQQQRAMKAIVRAKRLALGLGAGSGKTGVIINAFTHLRAMPETGVHRGLFLVPASIHGQVEGEFSKFADPQSLTWAVHPGADRETRLREHADPKVGAVVHTHQVFRDDMVGMIAEDWGVSPAEASDRFMGLSRREATDTLQAAWRKRGIQFQYLAVDEGHTLLDRDGKPDSVFSRIVQAASDATPYYVSSTADPVKNDLSELRSLLDKLNPDGRYADAAAWKRRYGALTTASREALQREIAPYVYAARVPTGNVVRPRRETVALHPKQRAVYGAVVTAANRLQAAALRGDVDVEAARSLMPDAFAKAPSDAEKVAAGIQRNVGIAREIALARVVNQAPAGENAKTAKVLQLLRGRDLRKEPVVIFAHQLGAVRQLHEALTAAGHRVEMLTGADSTVEREKKRQRFQPDAGEPSVDVFVLSDAAEAGMNLQRGHTLIQFDRPWTAKGHAQRNARIDRLGQRNPEIHLVDLATDTPFEARAQRRIDRKYALRETLTDPAADLDDTGLAAVFKAARRDAARRIA